MKRGEFLGTQLLRPWGTSKFEFSHDDIVIVLVLFDHNEHRPWNGQRYVKRTHHFGAVSGSLRQSQTNRVG
jgi:hypothetical protein